MKMKRLISLIAVLAIVSTAFSQNADEIIKKHLKATGGEKAWSAVKSIKMVGEISAQGQTMTMTNIRTSSGNFRVQMSAMGMDIVQLAYNGEYAWGMNMQTMGNEKKTGDEAENAKSTKKEFPNVFFNFKEKEFKAELLGTETINGEECYKLKINKGTKTQAGLPIDNVSTHYISTSTLYEIAREEEQYSPQMGSIKIKFIYGDFKEVNGLILPHTYTISQMGQEIPVTFAYEINGEIDNSIFSME